MKWTFHNQLWMSAGIVILFSVLTTLCKHWIIHSIGFAVCGLMWLVHPVLPVNAKTTPRNILALRCAGVILILMGIFVRGYYY